MREIEFEGYWSEREKQLWQQTDWKARDYQELPVEDDTIEGMGYFYSEDKGCRNKPVTFVKYIRSNPIFPPYYGPIFSSDLLKFLEEGHYMRSAMYDGHQAGNYDIHDRFETQSLYDILSR